MLHVGLDLSRTRLDYCLLDERGDRVEVGAAAPDGDGLRGFARRVELRHGPVVVRAAIESMNGARFVHDTLERCGWEVEVADAQKVKGPWAVGVQDRPHRRVGAGRALAP
jgi:transposase